MYLLTRIWELPLINLILKESKETESQSAIEYLDPQGRMTIQQWNTASQGVDYRIGPRETKIETCTFKLPDNLPAGDMIVTAVLNYQLLVKPVADFLEVPEEESQIIEVNRHSTVVNILD